MTYWIGIVVSPLIFLTLLSVNYALVGNAVIVKADSTVTIKDLSDRHRVVAGTKKTLETAG